MLIRMNQFLKAAISCVKDKLGSMAGIGSFEHWLQFELAYYFNVEIDKSEYVTKIENPDDAVVVCEWNSFDLLFYNKNTNYQHYAVELKLLWNNKNWSQTISGLLKKEAKKLSEFGGGHLVVVPVFYVGSDPDSIFGGSKRKSLLIDDDADYLEFFRINWDKFRETILKKHMDSADDSKYFGFRKWNELFSPQTFLKNGKPEWIYSAYSTLISSQSNR